MKRIILSLLLAVAFMSYAQGLQEVRGVETKQICKVTAHTSLGRGVYEDYCTYYICFTNQNDFPVSIDATLYQNGEEIDSKSFELDAQETYNWAIQKESCVAEYVGEILDRRTNRYVKFKAYKSNASVHEGKTPAKQNKDRRQLASTITKTQKEVTPPKEPRFEAKEIAASFPGGMPAFDQMLSSVVNDNSYGKGKVVLKFAVNKDGSMSDISVIENSLSSLNLTAISSYLSSADTPRWKPATQNGHPVKTYFIKGISIQ